MSDYLVWAEQRITDFSEANITAMYDRGFVCVRPENGLMQQTRSIRIDLSKFELSSENKRILRKTEDLDLTIHTLPYKNYTWEIGKMGKDFYEQKFGDGTFSANKIKELLTSERNDFNRLLCYVMPREVNDDIAVGYCIAVETNDILHYSYPFYILHSTFTNLGMGMMIRAIAYAKEQNKKYIYLGSFQRPGDIYKLQFSGMEWFDGKTWKNDVEELKNILL
ncbi:MAG: hypothetical protein Q7T50_00865 [Candidatus Magasanikbacteria bacterium]|nr:hypothetical protein [Candidatus Magasanikbacteria bacterium]